jgi:hypothetical protein
MGIPLTDVEVSAVKTRVYSLTYNLLRRHPLITEEEAHEEAKRTADEWFKRVKLAICEAEE